MKTYGGVEVQLHAFLSSVLDRSERSASLRGHFTRGETDKLRIGAPQSRSGRSGEKRNLLHSSVIK
jgi:hypothetical protein